MELQWPLILFTTFVSWSAGLFGTQGVMAISGNARKSQMPALIVSVVLLAISGISVFFHLEHWERIFNGFGHLSSGITQELIAIVIFAIVAVVYLAMLRKSKDGKTVPRWCAALAIAAAVALVAICAHSYMMAARPAWNSVLEVASVLGSACILGPATMAVIMDALEDEVAPIGMVVLIGAAIAAVCAVAYAVFLQTSGASFVDVGYYYDPTTPTSGMTSPQEVVSSQTLLIWIGGVVIGAFAPLAMAFFNKRKGTAANWKIYGSIAVACALIGAVCLRVAFYELGLSVFLFF